MTASLLVSNLAAAWEDRRDRAFDEVMAISTGPALFTRERMEQAEEAFRKARAEVKRWSQ